MRKYVVFHPWERLDLEDAAAGETLCSEATSQIISLASAPYIHGVTGPSESFEALRLFVTARACVLKAGNVAVNPGQGTVTLSGQWKFAFGNQNESIVERELSVEIANGWVQNKTILIMAKPEWGESEESQRLFYELETGSETIEVVPTRYDCINIDFVAVEVPKGGIPSMPLWWHNNVTTKEQAGYQWVTATFGDDAGSFYVFPVLPGGYFGANDSRIIRPLSLGQVVHALATQIARLIRPPLLGTDYLWHQLWWTTEPKDNIQALYQRSLNSAVRILSGGTIANQYNVISVIKSSEISQWTITRVTEHYPSQWVTAQLVYLGETAGLNAPLFVTITVTEGANVTVDLWQHGTPPVHLQDLPEGWAIDVLDFGPP